MTATDRSFAIGNNAFSSRSSTAHPIKSLWIHIMNIDVAVNSPLVAPWTIIVVADGVGNLIDNALVVNDNNRA